MSPNSLMMRAMRRPFAFSKQVPDDAGLAGAEKSGDHRRWYLLGHVLSFLSAPAGAARIVHLVRKFRRFVPAAANRRNFRTGRICRESAAIVLGTGCILHGRSCRHAQLRSARWFEPDDLRGFGHHSHCVRTGDRIRVSVSGRPIDMLVDDEPIARRRSEWTSPERRYQRGYGWMFTQHIRQANEGCDFDFLETGYGARGRRARNFLIAHRAKRWTLRCQCAVAQNAIDRRQATSRMGRVSGSGRARPDRSSSISTSSMTAQSPS